MKRLLLLFITVTSVTFDSGIINSNLWYFVGLDENGKKVSGAAYEPIEIGDKVDRRCWQLGKALVCEAYHRREND